MNFWFIKPCTPTVVNLLNFTQLDNLKANESMSISMGTLLLLSYTRYKILP